MEDFKTYCIVDRKLIPPERQAKRSNTCCKDCAKTLRRYRRTELNARRCLICNKPSTPEERKLFAQFKRALPGHQQIKRGRKAKA